MKQISDKLFIAPQLTAADIRVARANGIAAIINNRPDDEETGQPSASENRRTAEAAGLGYTLTEDPALPPQMFTRIEVEALVHARFTAEP